MSVQDLSGTTAVVTGASRGFGRGIATALVHAGAQVVAVARDGVALEELRGKLGEAIIPVVADAADPALAGQLIDQYVPHTLVLNAGASPLMRPIQSHTWETFSRNWEMDARQVFNWVREALLGPLAPGSTVVSMSSGAAVGGSPLSGGYAPAKAAVRFISAYAAGESARQGLGIRFVSVLPKLTPATSLGEAGVAAYAAQQGVDVATFLRALGPALTPERVGEELTALAADLGMDGLAYLLTADGLDKL
ncbi:SDR family oxidoreductase [Nonomuraea sp. 3-1Str]|uniref:SDR family oxidoreductase n=1 Tax=Nonomuraea sp. 3-1Str TaxID=2929801 RepID=UPI00285BD354|nr:SDR family oxidoreductase [Nonomuraea sp. 3-1Str]MDR8413693.1 SDR family oxidoreductase [Nonomuraea sp. 3-1Str]